MATRKCRWTFCLLAVAGFLWAGAPVSAQVYWVEEPGFGPPYTGGRPEFGDLDGDGDFDMAYGGGFHAYENVGDCQTPVWELNNGFLQGIQGGTSKTLCFADLDADLDLDLSVGCWQGFLYYYENVGTEWHPIWEENSSVYSGIPQLMATFPDLADLDDDGDLDLVVATGAHHTHSYRNVGTAQSPAWERDDHLCRVTAPYGYIDPNLGDLDQDGDLDIVISPWSDPGPIMCFENIGTASVSAWAENEDLLTGVDRERNTSGIDLVDIDGDGDLDLCVRYYEAPTFYLNCGTTSIAEDAGSWGRIKAMFR